MALGLGACGGPAGEQRQPAALEAWARRIRAWHDQRLDAYVYFNQDWEGFALEDAATLRAQTRDR